MDEFRKLNWSKVKTLTKKSMSENEKVALVHADEVNRRVSARVLPKNSQRERKSQTKMLMIKNVKQLCRYLLSSCTVHERLCLTSFIN